MDPFCADEDESLHLQQSKTQLSDPFRDPTPEEALEIERLFPTQDLPNDRLSKDLLAPPESLQDGICCPHGANTPKWPSKLTQIKKQICHSIACRSHFSPVYTMRAKFERPNGQRGSEIIIFVQFPSELPPPHRLARAHYLRVFELVTAKVPHFDSDSITQEWLDRRIIRVRGFTQSAEIILRSDLPMDQTLEAIPEGPKGASVSGNFITRRLRGLHKGQPKSTNDAESLETKLAKHMREKEIKAFRSHH